MIAQDIITDALRKIGVAAIDEAMSADQAASGLRALNRLLHSMQNREPDLWLVSSDDVYLTNLAAQTMPSCQPRRIISARFVRNGIETPMQELSRQEYDALPVKTSTGQPTCWYYDRQKCDGTLYVWPLLASPNGELVRVTFERSVKDAELGKDIDAPREWEEAIVYGLAARLADDYGLNVPNVVARAERELDLVLSRDREGSMFFGDPDGRY